MQTIEFRCSHAYRKNIIHVCFTVVKGIHVTSKHFKIPFKSFMISTQNNDYIHYLSTEEESNRLINMERSAEVFNEVLRLHKHETPDCAGLLSYIKEGNGSPL